MRRVGITHAPGTVWLEGRIPLLSRRIARAFQGCEAAALFVISLDNGPEAAAADEEGRFSSRYLTDLVRSCAIENAVEELQQIISGEIAGPGKSCTERYSPGYCDWPVSEQKKLFALLPPRPAGVRILSDNYMVPAKSISGIIGIGEPALVEKYGNACEWCAKQECPYRRNRKRRAAA